MTDHASVLIAGHVAPRLRIGYSLTFSLYQTVCALAAGTPESALGLSPDPRWRLAADRLRALDSPLGPFNYFEFAVLETADMDGFRHELGARAARFAEEFSDALSLVFDLYRRDVWPTHEKLLGAALKELAGLLVPRKDDLVDRLADFLNQTARPQECLVTLVPVCHVRVGGYSHPTVLDIGSFQGSQLLEAIVHELAHVFLALSRDSDESAILLFREAVRKRGYPDRVASDLFHLVMFYASGRIVTSSGLPDHRPVGTERDVYGRAARHLGVILTTGSIGRSLSRWESGTIDLPQAFGEMADSLTARKEETTAVLRGVPTPPD